MAKKHSASEEGRTTDPTREPKVVKVSRKEPVEVRAAGSKLPRRAKAER
jgi:hypothetical protein